MTTQSRARSRQPCTDVCAIMPDVWMRWKWKMKFLNAVPDCVVTIDMKVTTLPLVNMKYEISASFVRQLDHYYHSGYTGRSYISCHGPLLPGGNSGPGMSKSTCEHITWTWNIDMFTWTFFTLRLRPGISVNNTPLRNPEQCKFNFFTFHAGASFFFFVVCFREGGKEKDGRRGKRMEVTVNDSVDPHDPHDWSTEKVATFDRSLESNSVTDGDSVKEGQRSTSCFLSLLLKKKFSRIYTQTS